MNLSSAGETTDRRGGTGADSPTLLESKDRFAPPPSFTGAFDRADLRSFDNDGGRRKAFDRDTQQSVVKKTNTEQSSTSNKAAGSPAQWDAALGGAAIGPEDLSTILGACLAAPVAGHTQQRTLRLVFEILGRQPKIYLMGVIYGLSVHGSQRVL